ncbi:MAG TPA: alpha-ketoglutarate-dependent dioxygenase AlkB [Polyangiaceae bacterium]|nr:alpha-ketoglutarate-dependent dioxygenase AlkB [Polyangiaceae bacterium]
MLSSRNTGIRQLDLLGGIEARGPRRTALDASSWVEHVPGWFGECAELMALLAQSAGWEQRRRWMYDKMVDEPRLTAEYRVLAEAPLQLQQIGERLSAEYAVPYDRAWLNLYRDHDDSTSWHADKPCQREHCIVPVLSLGETRRFLIRPMAGGRSTTFVVQSGDLIVMGGRCQRDWVHSVPKEKERAGPRISINFASAVQASPIATREF